MEILVSFVILLLFFFAILSGIKVTRQTPGTYSTSPYINHDTISVEKPTYRKRFNILNKSEKAFFYELKKQLPSEYYIFPNMRVADMIDAVDGKGFYGRRNQILPKHIDFLICNKYFTPVYAIEVNGSSHKRVDRLERDETVRQIFAEAKLPLEFVDVGTNFAQAIARIISSLHTAHNA